MNYLEHLWSPEVLLRENNFLPHSACAEIRKSMLASPTYMGTIVKHDGIATVDSRIRRATNIEVDACLRSVVNVGLRSIKVRLDRYFGIETTDIQPTQYLLYRRGDFFRRHRDAARESHFEDLVNRKISVVLFLNDRNTTGDHHFEGGDLSFIGRFRNGTEELTRIDVTPCEGMLIAFPSQLLHEVLRVRRGLRFTAVSWLTSKCDIEVAEPAPHDSS